MIRNYQATFSAGEIAPEIAGRLDLATFTNGLLRCRNGIVKPQGSVFKRPGFRFIAKVKDSTKKTRLLTFRYGAGQNLLIEMGAGYFRFFQNGAPIETSPGVPYEVANPYAEADLFSIDYTQSFDVMTLAHPNYALRELRRSGPTSWTLATVNTTPVSITVTPITVTRTYGEVVQLNTNATVPDLARWDLGVAGTGVRATGFIVGDGVWMSGNADGTGAWDGNAAGEYIVSAVFEGLDPPGIRLRPRGNPGPIVGSAAGVGWARRTALGAGNVYQVTAVFADGSESLPAALATTDTDLDIEGSKNDFAWTAVAGAVGYRVYRKLGAVFGLLGEVTTPAFTDDGKVNPDTGKTPPRTDGVSYGNPGAVGYYEQRRALAGFSLRPQDCLLTRTGTESDLTFREPGQDDDRIAFRVSSRLASSIRFLLPLSQLVVLTDEDVFRLTPLNSDALTPESVAVRPQGGFGAAKVRPAIFGNVALYIAERGSHVLETSWQSEAQGYVPRDLSLRAPHLVENRTITDFAFLQSPVPVGFAATTDGKLLGMTYVPEERVGSWHWHDSPSQFSGTMATFESVTQVPEGDEDVLYVVVRRLLGDGLDGAVYYRCIERLHTMKIPGDPNQEVFLDSHLRYNGARGTTTLNFVGGAPAGTGIGYFINASGATFAPSDVGRSICLIETPAPASGFEAPGAGKRHYFKIVTYTNSTTVIARVLQQTWVVDGTDLPSTPRTNWFWAAQDFTIPHLPGAVLYGLADGKPVGPIVTNGTTGAFSLASPAVDVVVGLAYPLELQTLPPAAQTEGLTQGNTRAVTKASVKILQSGGYYLGRSPTDKVVPVLGAFDCGWSSVDAAPKIGPFFHSIEEKVPFDSPWSIESGFYIRQVSPLPLRVLGLTVEVQLGG